MTITERDFGKVADGSNITRFTVINSRGLSFSVINFGATITSFLMPDRKGDRANIVLSLDSLKEYLNNSHYLGATIGRFANRISGGRLVVAGKSYKIECNEQFAINGCTVKNHLHGGIKGFDSIVWQPQVLRTANSAGVRLCHISRDGEEGYPGRLDVTVEVTLNESNELIFDYRAETDRATVVNLTNHSYWNLGGAGAGTILDHELQLNCSNYLPIDGTMIPTGEIKSVIGTAMDFTESKPIGRDIDRVPEGYDHCFIALKAGKKIQKIAQVFEPGSGRVMEVSTTKPAVQLYTGNSLDGLPGAEGKNFEKHGGFCLETEFYPNAVNQPIFPSAILQPGECYHHRTVHYFSLEH